MGIYIDGIAARFYRGIGQEAQFIAPLAQMNIFIGENNSGKSVILNLIADQVSRIGQDGFIGKVEPIESFRGRETGQFKFAIGRNREELLGVLIQKIGDRRVPNSAGGSRSATDALRDILNGLSVGEQVFCSPSGNSRYEIFPSIAANEAKGWIDARQWSAIWNYLTGRSGGGLVEHWIPEIFSTVAKSILRPTPSVHLIPAKRVLSGSGEPFTDLSGRGLIDHLASLQNPSWNKQSDRDRFQKVNRFLQEVTGKKDATLEVPSDRAHLLVHMNNKVLPLSSLGTGIHEVVLIASFCTIHDGSIICLEEPEIHLHPVLQRKLINFLLENTSSQYLFHPG